MKKQLLFAMVSVVLVLSMLCSSIVFMGASAAADTNVALSVNAGNGKVKVEVNGSEVSNGSVAYNADVAKGAEVTLTAVVGEGEGRLFFWTDRNGYIVSTESKYSFTANADTIITPYFETVGKSTVIYRNNTSARKVLSVVALDAESLLDEHLEESVYKYGHTFTGWDLSVDDINAGIKEGKPAIFVDPYYEMSADKCDISVVGGKVNGSESVSVNMFDDVTLTPNDKATFVAWEDGDGNIISDKAELSVKAFKSETYKAVNSAKTLVPTAALYLTPDEDQIVHSRTLVFAPTGTTVVSYGLLYVKNTNYSTADMTVENVGNDNILKLAAYENPNGVLVNRFVDTDYVIARAYLTYTNGSTTETVYSDAMEMHSIDDDFWVGTDGKGDIFNPDSTITDETGDNTKDDSFTALHTMAGLTGATKSYTGTNGTLTQTFTSVSSATISNLRQSYLNVGFKLYSSAVMGNITSATYTRDSELIHLYWKNDYSWIKVVTSKREGSTLPMNIPTGSGSVQVIQLNGAYGFQEFNTSSDKSAYLNRKTTDNTVRTDNVAASGNGMGYVIKLSDGSFIVYDGGYYADAKEVAATIGNGIVRAWVITHGHGDHTGAFLEYIYRAKNGVSGYGANIERVIVAPANVGSGDKCYSINQSMKGVVNEAVAAGIPACYAHAGMVLNFGKVSMEILFVYEDLYMDKGDPFTWHAVYKAGCTATACSGKCIGTDTHDGAPNETSIVSRIKVSGGQSVMFLADTGHAGADRLLEYYNANSFLKSNWCQMSHHSCESFPGIGYDAIAMANKGTKWFLPSAYTLYSNNLSNRNKTVLVYMRDTYGAGYTAANAGTTFFIRNNTKSPITGIPTWNTQTIG